MAGTRLVVVPALHAGEEGTALFLDRQRAAWIAAARRACAGARVDDPLGELAPETAARLAAEDAAGAIVLAGGPRDDAAAEVLDAALRAAGLAVRRFEPTRDAEEAELASSAAPAAAERGVALPFLDGAAAVAALAETLARRLAADAAAPLVLELPLVRGARPPGTPSPLPSYAGFDDAAVRAAFTRLVDRLLPRHAAEWRLAVLRHELGVDPELEIYAGRHLRERNAECLANLVPPGPPR